MTNILVIGDAILDHYVFGKTNRQSPEDETIPVIDIEKEEYRLGGCLNVSSNLKSMNNKFNVFVRSIFSYDTCKKLMDKDIVVSSYSYPTIRENELVKMRIISNNKQIVRVDNLKKYKHEDLIKFHEDATLDLDSYQYIVISDYDKGIVNDKIIDALSKFKGHVFVDTKKSDLSIWKNIKNCIIKINQKEYENSSSAMSVKNLIVTRGANGCRHWFHLPPTRGMLHTDYPTTVVDNPEVTGCGDTFLAGLVTGFIKYKNLQEAIYLALELATKSAKHQGTVAVSL